MQANAVSNMLAYCAKQSGMQTHVTQCGAQRVKSVLCLQRTRHKKILFVPPENQCTIHTPCGWSVCMGQGVVLLGILFLVTSNSIAGGGLARGLDLSWVHK